MSWRRGGLALLVCSLVVSAGGLLPAAPAHAAAATRPDRSRIAPIAAVPADSVVDAYGVGIHLNFLDTPYADADAVAQRLADLGVRHVRDDLFLDSPRQYAAIATVAQRGIGFDLIMGRPDSGATPADYVDAVATQLPAGAVESLEGANEWDLFGPDDPADWVPQVKSWQQQLYAAAKAEPATADLPVLSPSLAFKQNYSVAGDLSQDADVANAHMYPGGYRPANEIRQITDALRASVPGKPLVTTEAGYHNAVGADSAHPAVPEDVAGTYLPRLLLEHVLRGDRRMYGYELIDEFDDPGRTDPEANFGLLRHDLTPKPAYAAMKNLLGLLADPGPSFSPGSLAVEATGLPPGEGRYVLTQRRDGRFVLLLWRDVSVWDAAQQEKVDVAPADVTLRFAGAKNLVVHRPSSGAAAQRRTTASALSLSLGGEVVAVTIGPPSPPTAPAPTHVRAKRGNASATVTWDLPRTKAHVTGFEISRIPGDHPRVVPARARSLRVTRLTNGTRYVFNIRALTAHGSSRTVSTRPVVPATVPTAPHLRVVRAGPHRVTVTWTRSAGRGSPVTAYRLVCLGRTVKVGPGKRRATIAGLPSHRRVRVAVRARNGVGWGRAAYTRYVTTSG
ncbi:hypothetical protein ASC77_10120 [Nocardioides sp. Root1257]|nr:hypothetical protein ASC77_10120 [Nocardioides sp. Root1257]KRC48226.1 hypothetical protein ASE24_10125 [Nocardioides sp. Root224]